MTLQSWAASTWVPCKIVFGIGYLTLLCIPAFLSDWKKPSMGWVCMNSFLVKSDYHKLHGNLKMPVYLETEQSGSKKYIMKLHDIKWTPAERTNTGTLLCFLQAIHSLQTSSLHGFFQKLAQPLLCIIVFIPFQSNYRGVTSLAGLGSWCSCCDEYNWAKREAVC